MRLATAISTSTSTPPSDEQEAIGARGFPWFHDHHAWLIGKGVELAAIFLGDLHGGLDEMRETLWGVASAVRRPARFVTVEACRGA